MKNNLLKIKDELQKLKEKEQILKQNLILDLGKETLKFMNNDYTDYETFKIKIGQIKKNYYE
ncbi:MAG: hypothetical protein ACYCT7_01680 [bacterium]